MKSRRRAQLKVWGFGLLGNDSDYSRLGILTPD